MLETHGFDRWFFPGVREQSEDLAALEQLIRQEEEELCGCAHVQYVRHS